MEKSSEPSSPEFEFWMVHNPPSFPLPISADQLFADGVLLPTNPINPSPALPPSPPAKWKNIFNKNNNHTKKKKSNAAERKTSVGPAAEQLNINIWPFSRSRSAGTARSKASPALLRKSSSASGGGGVGIRVGRAAPVWRLRRRSDGNAAVGSSGDCGRVEGCREGGGNGRMFNNLRTIFSKKVY